MSIRRKDLHELVDQLSPYDQKTAYDFLAYLINRNEKDFMLEADNEPLTEEEKSDLQAAQQQIEKGDVVDWKDIKRGLEL